VKQDYPNNHQIHWGLVIGSADTEAVSVSEQEGGLGIGIITGGLGISTRVKMWFKIEN